MSLSHGLSAAPDSSDQRSFVGRTVLCTDGQKIGTVKDVYDDSSSGVVFASVSTGLLSGRSFIPFGQVSWQGEDLVVPFSKDFVKGSPSIAADDELSPGEEAQIFEYYGLSSIPSDAYSRSASTGSAIGTPAGYTGPGGSGPTGTADVGADDAITRSEERLSVGTERVTSGTARLRKRVVSDALRREEAAADVPAPSAGRDSAVETSGAFSGSSQR